MLEVRARKKNESRNVRRTLLFDDGLHNVVNVMMNILVHNRSLIDDVALDRGVFLEEHK